MSSGVEFDEDRLSYGVKPRPDAPNAPAGNLSSADAYAASRYANAGSQPKMIGWLLRHGLAKSPQTAQIYLIAIVVINVIITYVIIKYFL
jgi:hypothetical protein